MRHFICGITLAFNFLFSTTSAQSNNATINDTTYASKIFQDAKKLISQREYDSALPKLDSASRIYSKVIGEESLVFANVIYVKAIVFYYKNQFYESIEAYKKVLSIRTNILGNEHSDVASVYNNMGATYEKNGDYAEAITHHQKALQIRQKIFGSEHPQVAISSLNLANSYTFLGDYNKAIELYQKAYSIRLKTYGAEHQLVSNVLNNLAATYEKKGDFEKAIQLNRQALAIRLKLLGVVHVDLADTYNNLGILYEKKGDYDKAIEYHLKALSIVIKLFGDMHQDVSRSYNNLGLCYDSKGDYDKAIEYHRKALLISSNIYGVESSDVAESYGNIAIVFSNKNLYDTAIDYHTKALSIRLKKYGSQHLSVAESLNNLGVCYRAKGNYEKATELYEKALEIRVKVLGSKHYEVARSFNNLANAYSYQDKYDNAIKYHQEALTSYQYLPQMNLDSVTSINDVITTLKQYYATLIRQYVKTQDTVYLAQVYELSNQALNAVTYQFKAMNTEGSKAALLKNSLVVYENAIVINQLKIKTIQYKNILRESFSFAEKAKSFILLGSLKENEGLSYADIPDSLLQKESDLRIDIAFYEKRRFEEENKGKEAKDSIVNSYNSQLFDLKRSYETLKERFEKDYPDYYRLKYDLSVVGIEEVQQKLLKPDQTLLEYFVGDSSVFIFTVNKDNYKVLEVKKDFSLDSLVEVMRTGIYGTFSKSIRDDSLSQRTRSYIESATQLYDKLVAPVKSLLRGSVVVIPDGVLGYIPFDALLVNKPNNIAQAEKFNYLLNDHKISYCYSATILKDMVNKKHRQEPTQTFLAMAPYFKGDTSIIKSDSLDVLASNNDTRPSGLRNGLDSLPNTGEEVTRLQRMMGGEAIVGKSATEAVFTQKASAARIIHLSTHGKMDDKVGDYSYLAFTEQPDSIENEWLYTRELYNISLNADMVVLSACETGIGKLQRGEGIISLARAFAYAGAKSIVTTLWQVKDESTKDIMLLFYQNLKKGKDKDEALWLAKKAYIKKNKKELALPFFWSGIIPIGDMQPIGK